jgi:IS1 family transposase
MSKIYSTHKKNPIPRVSLSSRFGDLESFVSDTAAHVADLESRLEVLKTKTVKILTQRVADLESQSSDCRAHLADLETRMERYRKSLKRG